ncbi:hypothetical protein [Paenibacillus sp. YYML68]|uniref:hypothetical protein n=1 Tax=Paenibacillus sp. YYML68 TaxID=2909250 RepID=UPI00248F757E|nr:hypothetical protein [Paenibacillus sp. YYML68]
MHQDGVTDEERALLLGGAAHDQTSNRTSSIVPADASSNDFFYAPRSRRYRREQRSVLGYVLHMLGLVWRRKRRGSRYH